MPMDPLYVITLPPTLLLVGLLVLAVAYDLRISRRARKKKETLYRCAECRRIYTTVRHTPTAACPKCGKHNPAVRSR